MTDPFGIQLPGQQEQLIEQGSSLGVHLFMTSRVAGIISARAARAKGTFLFSNGKGEARGYNIIAIRKAFHRAGLHDCTVHTLRHTHASRLIQYGLSVYEVKAVLGHSDIRTTMRYAHLEEAKVTIRARDVIERLTTTQMHDNG